MVILVINCGSTTLKYQLFRLDGTGLSSLASGAVEIRRGYRQAVTDTLQSLPAAPEAIAHRVVHGGARLTGVVQVDAGVLNRLRELGPLAPLHNGPALEGIEASLGLGIPLLAAFDTGFHRTLPTRAWRYAIPAPEEVRRYGFHGWSHQSVMEQYARLSGNSQPTMISLHLGSGCSATAIERGRSVDTSMGFTPLEGLVMGTRPGDLDTGVLIHLMTGGMSLDQLRQVLHHDSGLRAIAGTDDMRELLGRSDDAALLAIEIFCYRVLKYVGAYLAILGGAEAIVFTGGIGEHSPEIRRRICEGLRWLGLTLDQQANERADRRISTPASPIGVFVLPADEERVIAREAGVLLLRDGARGKLS